MPIGLGDLAALRIRAGALVEEGLFRSAARLGRLHPLARPERHDVEVAREIPYGPGGTHRLDRYRPTRTPGPWPIILYTHGGSFRILSKDTHWLMGLIFAKFGYLVFNIDYRLAPAHPFPAALEDAAMAYDWVVRNGAAHGGDPARIVLAGESAGANLATALAVSACYARPEPYARLVYDTQVTPRAVVAACGILQVSDTARFSRRKRLPLFVADRLTQLERDYLSAATLPEEARALADPLLVLEGAERPARPLPAFFAPVGTADPLLDDSRRLAAAAERLGAVGRAAYYPGEAHAFHALVFRRPARACWRDTLEFLRENVGPAIATG